MYLFYPLFFLTLWSLSFNIRKGLTVFQVSFTVLWHKPGLHCFSSLVSICGPVSKWVIGMLANVMCTSLSHSEYNSSGEAFHALSRHVGLTQMFTVTLENICDYGGTKTQKENRCWFSTWNLSICLIRTTILDFGLRRFLCYSS